MATQPRKAGAPETPRAEGRMPRRAAFGSAMVAFVVAVVASACFELRLDPPLFVTCAVFGFAVWMAVVRTRLSPYSLLVKYIMALYALPFIHGVEYLFVTPSDLAHRKLIWGLAPNPYNVDVHIVARMMEAGAIGAAALASGMLLAGALLPSRPPGRESGKRLAPISIGLVTVLALCLSWANAPRQTVFQAAYTQSASPLTGSNFNAAFLVSYTFAAILVIDALLSRRNRRLKWSIAAATLAVIVVWFQFMRGDRESMGLVAAVLAICLVGRIGDVGRPVRGLLKRKRQLVAAAVTVAVLFVAAQFVGAARSVLAGRPMNGVLNVTGVDYLHGTWSAALLSPLSVVGDFERGRMSPRYGQTYIDYALSLPPGFVTAFLGIERPLEGTHGPAWDMRYGVGGTHVMVVPFMNFRTPGVVVVLLLYGLIVGTVELNAGRNTVKSLLWYATFFIIGPFWMWYGEMSLARGVMAFYATWIPYRVLHKRSSHAPPTDETVDLRPATVV